MTIKFRVIILFTFLITLCVNTHALIPITVYCNAELSYNRSELSKVLFLREFVLPDTGPYERCLNTNKIENLHPDELVCLREIESQLDLGPVYIRPFFLQFSSQDYDGKKRIESLSIVLQESIIPPLIDPTLSVGVGKTFNIEYLIKLHYLKHLELYSFNVSNIPFDKIYKLGNLKYLGVPFNTSDQDLNEIIKLKELESLNLSGTTVKGSGLKSIAELPVLQVLDLRGLALDSNAFSNLKGCHSLRTLLLSNSNVTDVHLQTIADLESLECLTLHNTGISDDSLFNLARLKNLKYVSIYGTRTTEKGHAELLNINGNLVIDYKQPQNIDDFLLERLYLLANMGNVDAQIEIANKYEWAINLHNRFPQIYSEKINKIREQPWQLFPSDHIELLKWGIIISGAKREPLQYNSDAVKNLLDEIKIIRKNVNPVEIAEAQRRARVYELIHNGSNYTFKTEHPKVLPLYQYGFETVGK